RNKWQFDKAELISRGWLDEDAHLGWRPGKTGAQAFIEQEIHQLFELMEDDRDRYLGEINAQADGLAGYVISFLGIDSERRPYTVELIRCGLAIGNIFYFYYKQLFRRVRASRFCPDLQQRVGRSSCGPCHDSQSGGSRCHAPGRR